MALNVGEQIINRNVKKRFLTVKEYMISQAMPFL